MIRLLVYLFCCMLLSCRTTSFYIVRHAEKAGAVGITSDMPLTEAGTQRALALKDSLLHKNIQHIYTTNYKRTLATVQPLSKAAGVSIELYNLADHHFINQLRGVPRGNVLVVGHSNTVDDLVNGLTRKKLLQDLPDTAYGDIFIITKKGSKYTFLKMRFGL
jgi:phosphohistidine phosphatase SixA